MQSANYLSQMAAPSGNYNPGGQVLPNALGAFMQGAAPTFGAIARMRQAEAPMGYDPQWTPQRDRTPAQNALASYGGGPTREAADAMDRAPEGGIGSEIYWGLIDRGLPAHVAQGFVMNMKDESGLNPGINEIAPIVPGSRGGFGLYQLTGPRRVAFERFAQERGMPLDSVDAQLDFLKYELDGPEARAARAIFSTQTPGEAAAAIVNRFLRPAEEHRERRASRYLQWDGGNPFEQRGRAPAMPDGFDPRSAEAPRERWTPPPAGMDMGALYSLLGVS